MHPGGSFPRSGAGLLVLSAAVLAAFYLFGSFSLSGDANILKYSSGIYDMDVGRVVDDWTTQYGSRRLRVHPLYKLVVAPLGGVLRDSRGGGQPAGLEVVRCLIALGMALHALLAGWLAAQLSRSWAVAIAAALLCGVSFSSVLLGTIPESASLACLAGIASLVFLNARLARRLTWGEAGAWGLLGLLGIALTITQIMYWLVALTVRVGLLLLRPEIAEAPAPPPRGLAARVGVAVAIATLLTAAGSLVQSRVYPRSYAFYDQNPVANEAQWFRTEDIREAPLEHGMRLVRHFLIYDFVAPFPAMSDYLMHFYRNTWKGRTGYWTLSLEEASWEGWRLQHIPLLGLHAAFLAFAISGARSMDVRFLAPLVCLAGQIGLHFLYGREYILYSPHWHGTLCAVLVALAFRSPSAARRWLPAVMAALVIGTLANSVVVLRHTYAEVAAGLHRSFRDDAGILLPEEARPKGKFQRLRERRLRETK